MEVVQTVEESADESIVEQATKPESTAWEKFKNLRPLQSTKPFLITTRDALIVSVITVLVTIIIMFFLYLALGNLGYLGTGDFWFLMGRGFVISMVLQYAYEYIGFNAMLAESSIRYAKGSALEKFKSRRHAFFAQIAYEEARKALADPNIQKQIDNNMTEIGLLIEKTTEVPIVIDLRKKNMNKDAILAKINKRKEYLSSADLDVLLKYSYEVLGKILTLIEWSTSNEALVGKVVRDGINSIKDADIKTSGAKGTLSKIKGRIMPVF